MNATAASAALAVKDPGPGSKWTGPRLDLPMKTLIDRASVDARIAAAAQAHGGATLEFRKAAVDIFAEAMAQGRELARKTLEAKGSGLACAAHIAFVEDELLRSIHSCVVKYIHPKAATGKLCVVAVGGYGRGTLAPGSDIDLLFLLRSHDKAGDEAIVEAMLYFLWDLKQKVGHATRTVDECLRQAKADMTIRTTLLETRFILGDRSLLETVLARFDHEIVRHSAPEFVAAKLAERDQRVQRAGASRYLVEPNVKEGKGGLRDLNTLFWIAKYVYRVQEAEALVGVGLFSEQELRLFRRCETFLWKVRCTMHFITQRPEERLSFDVQRLIAEKLGYSTRDGMSAVERFMKHYFTIAKSVGDLTNIVCAALEERQAKPRAVFDRFVGKFRRRGKPRDLGPFALETGRVTVASNDVFDKEPINLLRLFSIAARNELPIHPDALRLVTQSPAAHRRPFARRSGSQPPVPRHPHHAAIVRADPAADERSRRAREIPARFRPHRRDDAVQHVPPLHGGRASLARAGRTGGGGAPPFRQRTAADQRDHALDLAPPRPLRRLAAA